MKIPKSFDPWYTNGRNLGVPIGTADAYIAAGATAVLEGRTITLSAPGGARFVGARFVTTIHLFARSKAAKWINEFNTRSDTRSDQLWSGSK